ncbi:MAG TPA: RNA polymerase sigma factor [Candidatus Limnocylindrales bacterium]|nr:RNA polymerase sigma factor [Candidatus Limnocylindrales bacterium]
MEERPMNLARAVEGNAESFARLIEPMLDSAYRLAAVMLNDRPAAEDAVQEASIKAWRKIRQLRGDATSLRPWFLAIVANECRMSRRTRWWSVLKLGDQMPPGRQDAESYTDLHSALLRLSPDERLPLILHFYLDLPLDELAKTLGTSQSAAKSRVYRAAKRLRADLTQEDVI